MKVLTAIENLNAVTYEVDGKQVPLLKTPIDMDFADMDNEDLQEIYMLAVESIVDNGNGEFIPQELGEVYNVFTESPQQPEAPALPPAKITAKKKDDVAVSKEKKKEVADKFKPEVKKAAVENPVTVIESNFTFENCPSDYEGLKAEAKQLATSSATSFLLLGQRLKVIRDLEMYKPEYPDFKSFITGEIKISRTTAYNFIDLVTCFGVQALGQVADPSKLIPAIPLLKAREEQISKADKKDLRTSLLKEAKTKSWDEMNKEVKGLKVQYGLVPEKVEVDPMEYAFGKLMSVIPDDLSKADVKQVQKFIKKLTELIED